MAPIDEGDKIPSIEMDSGFPPKKVNMADYVKGESKILSRLKPADISFRPRSHHVVNFFYE
jgi:hypothetical protein